MLRQPPPAALVGTEPPPPSCPYVARADVDGVAAYLALAHLPLASARLGAEGGAELSASLSWLEWCCTRFAQVKGKSWPTCLFDAMFLGDLPHPFPSAAYFPCYV